MRAFALDAFGMVGSIQEVPDPEPGEGEVLVRVKAAGLNATDCACAVGMLKDYFEHRWPLVLGLDASGVVEQVGPGVDGFKVGDEVYGYVQRPVMGVGTLAEWVALPIGGIQHKPASLSHEQAAVIPHAGLTAAATVDAAALTPGERLVILGASGGVGSYAMQMASGLGAHVIAVTRSQNAEYASSLGAADWIDYEAADPAEVVRERYPDGVHAVIDLVGDPRLTASVAESVLPGGRVVSAVMPPDIETLAQRGVEGILTYRYAAEHRFPEISARIADGELKIPAMQTFAFEDVGAAMDLQATRHVRGKVAVIMN